MASTPASSAIAFVSGGTVPTGMRSGANQAAVATTGATTTSPYGYTTAAQADGIVTLLNEIRLSCIAAGIMKGAA